MSDIKETVEVPDYVKDVCSLWHDGQWSLLYSVASTGKVQYKNLFQLINDLPNASDAEDDMDRIAIRNSRAWVNQFLTDQYFDRLNQDELNEEDLYSND